MKVIMETQVCENYGAHDWDGEGECPQHWKMKGGNTYIVDGVGIEDASSEEFYDTLIDLINIRDEYWEEYVLGTVLVDEVDFKLSNHIETWEKPIMVSSEGGKFIASKEHYLGAFPPQTWTLGEAL